MRSRQEAREPAGCLTGGSTQHILLGMKSARRQRVVYRASASKRLPRPTEPDAAAEWNLGERLDRLVATLGSNRVAEILGVSVSQPSRWRRGVEHMSPQSQRRLLDLDYVMARLLQLFPREQAEIWLTSHNAHLGARPLDVLQLRGAGPVVAAADAEAQGAYA